MSIKWQSEEKDINDFFRSLNTDEDGSERQGPSSPLPYRFHTIDRVKPGNKWTARANETVYRFFGDIRANVIRSKDGSESIQLKTDGRNFRRQFMQELWTDVGRVQSADIPFYLRRVPVPGWTPLARASGLMTNGKPNTILSQRNNAGNPPYDAKKGIKPVLYHWAACHITQYIEVDEVRDDQKDAFVGVDPSTSNAIIKYEFPAIVLMKKWQVEELLKALEGWREHLGYGWSAEGYPLHLLNQTLARQQDTGLKVSKGGIFREEDAEVFDMSEQTLPDFDTMALAIINELDEFLVNQSCPIKGWPEDMSHPEGWNDPEPLVISQLDASNRSGLEVFASKEPTPAKKPRSSKPSQEEPPFETDVAKPSNNTAKWDDYSIDDLLDVAMEYGIKVPAASKKNRQKLIFLIETAQANI